MSFLNSGLLFWLLPLLGLPLLIHLLNRKFPQTVVFPNVEHVRRALARRSKLLRWRHLILTLIRTLAVLLLLLAFLQPIRHLFGTAPVDAAGKRILIVIDNSLSMEFQEGRATGREKAMYEAERLLDSLEPGTPVNILRAGRAPALAFADFSPLHGEAFAFLRRTEPHLGPAQFDRANAEAIRLLQQGTGPAEVYFISDFQRRTWSNIGFDGFPEEARIFFVDVSARVKSNRAILDARVGSSAILMGETVPLEVTVANYSDEPYEDRVEVWLDGRFVAETDVVAGPWATARVSIPVTFSRPGLHAGEARIGEDRLPHDNRRFLSIDVLDKEEVLLVTDSEGAAGEAAFFLSVAINPFVGDGGALLANRVRSADLTALHLATVNKLILTGVGEIGARTAELLADFLFRGGGAILFLDGGADRQNVESLHQALRGGALPFRITHWQTAENIPGGFQQVLRGDFRSPFLRIFSGTHRQALGRLQFYEYYHALPTGEEAILLHFADGTPAMGSAQVGAGTLLLCNFSVSELGSNLARERVFPAWLQEMVRHVDARENEPPNYLVGGTISREVWREDYRDAPFRGPGGQEISVRRQPNENRLLLWFTPEEPGMYSAPENSAALAFAVNIDPAESDLRQIDPDRLAERVAKKQGGHHVAGGEDYEHIHRGRPVFHYFALALLGVLLGETLFCGAMRRLSRK
jgi:hypothetical protein